jgi:hypothetical protein
LKKRKYIKSTSTIGPNRDEDCYMRTYYGDEIFQKYIYLDERNKNETFWEKSGLF